MYMYDLKSQLLCQTYCTTINAVKGVSVTVSLYYYTNSVFQFPFLYLTRTHPHWSAPLNTMNTTLCDKFPAFHLRLLLLSLYLMVYAHIYKHLDTLWKWRFAKMVERFNFFFVEFVMYLSFILKITAWILLHAHFNDLHMPKYHYLLIQVKLYRDACSIKVNINCVYIQFKYLNSIYFVESKNDKKTTHSKTNKQWNNVFNSNEQVVNGNKICRTSTLDAITLQTEAMKSFYRAVKGSASGECVCVCDASAFEGVLYTIQTMRKMCNTYVSSSFHPHAAPDKQTTSIQIGSSRDCTAVATTHNRTKHVILCTFIRFSVVAATFIQLFVSIMNE